MGKVQDRSLGCESAEGRLSNPLYQKHPSSHDLDSSGIFIISGESREIYHPKTRGGRDDQEGCNRSCAAKRTCLLQPAVLSPKARREVASSTRCVLVEQICTENKIFYGNTSNRTICDKEERLVSLSGHERRLLSCPNSSAIEKIPKVRIQREKLSVQGSMFRANYGATSVHSGISPYGENSTPGRIQNVVISRRLVDLSKVEGRDIESKAVRVEISKGTRDNYKHRKVAFGTVTTYNISGDEYRHRPFLGFPSTETSRRLPESLRKIHILQTASSSILAQLAGSYVIPGKADAGGEVEDETDSVLSQESLGQEGTWDANTSTYSIGSETGSGMVELKRKGRERNLSSVKRAQTSCYLQTPLESIGERLWGISTVQENEAR